MLPITLDDGQQALCPATGGAVFNTAIACGRLGMETGLVSGISTDLFGAKLRQELCDSRVDTQWLISSDQPTTLAFVSLNKGQAVYTFYDENTAGRMLEIEQLSVIPNEVTAMFFGGISLINNPCADFYRAIVEREHAERVIMLDPNIRPVFIHQEQIYRDRLNRIIECCDILKFSDEDLDWLVPGEESVEDKARRFSKERSLLLILTFGDKGAEAYRQGELIAKVDSIAVDVVDTVGAGDTFNAGFLASLDKVNLLYKRALPELSHLAVTTALEFAAKAAAIVVSRAGANPPWDTELP